MQTFRGIVAMLVAMCLAMPTPSFAANHREAPITALDRAADITDWYAFVSYDDGSKVTFILNVDGLQDPGNGPTYFPFDPDIVYSMKVDNNNDAVEDVTFEFRFQTEIRAPGVFTSYVGAGTGITAPGNAPAALDGTAQAGKPVVPPAVTSLDGAGSAGLNLRQNYTVTMVQGTGATAVRTDLTGGQKLFVVPANIGSRTMPNYAALFKQGIYSLGNGVRVFAGTVDDPFYIDLGGTFDSLNLRGMFTSGVTGVLTAAQDSNDTANIAPDSVAGSNVNSIAIEVPISMLVQGGKKLPATDPHATIGTWGATYRPRVTVRTAPDETQSPTPDGTYRQVQRMGNPLINELIIGVGSKDRFSMSQPKDDAQFASFALDPVLARVLNAIYGIAIPAPPRKDLLPLVTYAPPIAAVGTPPGPVSDLLRLNTGVNPTAKASRSRLGLLAGDAAGFPNGRRPSDDVVDISLRAVAGVLAGAPFNGFPYNALGDGVNVNDNTLGETFPYEAPANSGLRVLVPPPAAPAPTPPKNLGSYDCVRNPNSCT